MIFAEMPFQRDPMYFWDNSPKPNKVGVMIKKENKI